MREGKEGEAARVLYEIMPEKFLHLAKDRKLQIE